MSHIKAKRWREIEKMLAQIGVKHDFKRGYIQPFSRGALVKHRTPLQMVFDTRLGALLWWNGEDKDTTQEAIAYLQMVMDIKTITVLR